MISQPFPTRGSMWGNVSTPLPYVSATPQVPAFRYSVRPSYGPITWGDPADSSSFATDMERIIKAFQAKDAAKGAALIANAALVHGPKVVEMGQEIANSSRDSIPELEQKLAKYKFEYARAVGEQKLKWKYKIEAIERQIKAMRNMQQSALQALSAPAVEIAPPSTGLPSWLPMALIGGGLLLGATVLLARR